MTLKARIIDNVAIDVVTEDTLEHSFHPSLWAEFEDVPDDVQPGWVRSDAGVWAAPSAPAHVDPPVKTTTVIGPIQFMLRFSPGERVAIRNAAKTDPLIEDFLTILNDVRTLQVDLADPSVDAAVAYMGGATAAPNPVIGTPLYAPTRIMQILAPQPIP
jgi:hypothetical protein